MIKTNFLAMGAHPDDIEFGCGTLIKFANKGHRLFMLVMTEGELGGDTSERVKEQSGSQVIMGVEHIFWGGYKDTNLVVDNIIISKIEDVISEVKPSFIFCHFPDDTHQDHRHLAQATVSATRYIRNVLFYEGPTAPLFKFVPPFLLGLDC
ncbi:MAG: hypothetical protein GY749_41775 [Desulfobacteraceae bacterium]|nr:hypothetical protein [Desulfobacteraceae bacterium]